jgi:hypothetical protein
VNVTEDLLRRYIEEFNNTFLETARTFLPKEVLELLLRYPLIRGNIIGYVSTQFGAGFEYLGRGSSCITTRRSSRPIEDLFTGAPARIRKLQPLIKIEGNNVILAKVTTKVRFPFRLASDEASVRFINARFTAQGWRRDVVYAELYGNRTAEFWSEVNAVRRAKDEILLAILDVKEAEKRSLTITEYLQNLKEKTVLVLGDFNAEGRTRLKAIRKVLAGLSYSPILLDQIPDDFRYDLQQKAIAIGSLARFVVIDDSSKSGHLVEFVHAQTNRWVTIVLRLEGSKGSFMTHGLSSYSKVMRECTYSFANLPAVLSEAVQWAEETIIELKLAGMHIYPWRTDVKKEENGT